MSNQFYTYILASHKNGTLYIGVTSDIMKRIYEHKNQLTKGFSSKYGIHDLVYYEIFQDAENAIKREKRLKKYSRAAKIGLIEKENPNWDDLYASII